MDSLFQSLCLLDKLDLNCSCNKHISISKSKLKEAYLSLLPLASPTFLVGGFLSVLCHLRHA